MGDATESLGRIDPFPAGAGPVPGTPHAAYVAARLAETGRWGTDTIADQVGRHAAAQPARDAYISVHERMSWAGYERRSDELAGALINSGLEAGDRLAVLLPDGPSIHVAFVGAEKAGLTVVGIGPRAAIQEIRHLVTRSGATALLSLEQHRGSPTSELVETLRADGLPIRHHFVLDARGVVHLDGVVPPVPEHLTGHIALRKLGLDALFLLNSTSGTTGLPKCVAHHQNRWLYYHQLAIDAGDLTTDDLWMSLIPAPFGFGIWTSHVTPAVLGCPTVVMERFTPEGALELIERERVTVMACVTTQFIMMLNSPAIDTYDLSSLRAMFTGGEAVPYARSAEFEERTGARVLQFYGSNETGALSYTSMRDTRERRLTTGGRVIEGMDVHLVGEDGRATSWRAGGDGASGDVASGDVASGQAACRGPATCLGYYDDADANAALITDDGLMLTGDIATVDEEGYLCVVGRKSDFIIRGGKNISAVVVEEQVATHPSVAMAAAVAMPDEIFGERVCVYLTLVEGADVTLDELVDHLRSGGYSKETFPERIELVDELPRSSGGKIAKGELRADIRRRLQA